MNLKPFWQLVIINIAFFCISKYVKLFCLVFTGLNYQINIAALPINLIYIICVISVFANYIESVLASNVSNTIVRYSSRGAFSKKILVNIIIFSFYQTTLQYFFLGIVDLSKLVISSICFGVWLLLFVWCRLRYQSTIAMLLVLMLYVGVTFMGSLLFALNNASELAILLVIQYVNQVRLESYSLKMSASALVQFGIIAILVHHTILNRDF